MTHTNIALIAAFFDSFGRTDLYDTGFADVARQAGACDEDSDLVRALAYVKGYADCAMLASTVERWRDNGAAMRIAQSVGGLAGMLLACRDAKPSTIEHMLDRAEADLLAILGKAAA
jgi:hypothetical protein